MSEFEACGAVVFGVSPDSVSSHLKFMQKYGLKTVLLSDPDHKVLEAYGAWGLKKMYGKEYSGVKRSTAVIDPEGLVAAVWPSAKPKGHAIEVLSRLKKLTQ